MKEMGYTHKTLADKCNLPLVVILQICSGKLPGIQFKELDALCRVLQCTPGNLLDYTREE